MRAGWWSSGRGNEGVPLCRSRAAGRPGLRGSGSGSGSGSSSRRGGRGTRGPGAGTGSAALLLSARGMVAGASVRFRCVDGVDVGPDEYPLNTSVAKLKALLVEQLKGRGTPACRRCSRAAARARSAGAQEEKRARPGM